MSEFEYFSNKKIGNHVTKNGPVKIKGIKANQKQYLYKKVWKIWQHCKKQKCGKLFIVYLYIENII